MATINEENAGQALRNVVRELQKEPFGEPLIRPFTLLLLQEVVRHLDWLEEHIRTGRNQNERLLAVLRYVDGEVNGGPSPDLVQLGRTVRAVLAKETGKEQ